MSFTPAVDAALARALDINTEIQKLYDEQDALLNPLVVQAMHDGEAATRQLLARLPDGFYRSELQTWLNQREVASSPVADTPKA